MVFTLLSERANRLELETMESRYQYRRRNALRFSALSVSRKLSTAIPQRRAIYAALHITGCRNALFYFDAELT